MRPSGRSANQMREIRITRNYTMHAEGSVLVEFGNTKVICTASVDTSVPPFLRGKGQGWVTAEYGMLPRSTGSRMQREAARGKQQGRTVEISRLIGRSLRAAVDVTELAGNSVLIDCDVSQADGDTRTAAITGACVAMVDGINWLLENGKIKKEPFKQMIDAVSVGIYKGEAVLDIEHDEASYAETDLNVVMTENGGFVEIQVTAEGDAFTPDELNAMLALAQEAIVELSAKQKASLA